MSPASNAAFLTALCTPRSGRKGSFVVPVLDQFDASEKSAPTDITDMGVLSEDFLECALQPVALVAHLRHQVALDQSIEHRETRRTGDRMSHIGMTVLEES